ncbi:MAG: carboxypeptidase regulatory-like domain-containing protein, partial [Bacteroidetes bacterium]|nr:carboxypeptidase regulatory-like domain-containing protein [Bacteroidota bacterium]
MTKTFACILLLLPRIVFAQYLVSGKVLSSNNAPVANANVFLNHATIGGKTADDGAFTLRDVKPGTY